jgi:glycosyltransferase involved in cell wall biosynthesis
MSHLDPQFGGIAGTVPQLCRATEAEGGYQCPIVGFCNPAELDQLSESERVRVIQFPPDRMGWMVNMGMRQQLKQLFRSAQGVHIHGIWETHCTVASGIARSCKTPYIISAHGMLDDWALTHKRLKKALYAALLETNNLQRAACLRALTRDEVTDYRRIGLRTPVAVVPSGVQAPEGVTGDVFREAFPQLAGKRMVLFMGRLHPKKGLPLLLQAWHQVAESRGEDSHLVIAGPDSENLLGTLRQMTEDLKLRDSVTFTGMLKDELKWSALAAAELFVLPSFSEGFSVAVLEALAMGIPAIVSSPCHFPEITEANCGWVIEPETHALELSLREYLQMRPSELTCVGERARGLIERRFTWAVIGKQMEEVYSWLQGGPKPTSVEVS